MDLIIFLWWRKIFMSQHTFLVVLKIVLFSTAWTNFRLRKQLFMFAIDKKKCAYILKSHVPSLGILIRHFHWLKAFQFSCFIRYISRLAFGLLSKKKSQHENWKDILPIGKSYWSAPEMKNTNCSQSREWDIVKIFWYVLK